MQKKEEKKECEECQGTGKVICTNPDHGFIEANSFNDVGRLGCPTCGHDELYRTKDICGKCKGTGEIEDTPSAKVEEIVSEFRIKFHRGDFYRPELDKDWDNSELISKWWIERITTLHTRHKAELEAVVGEILSRYHIVDTNRPYQCVDVEDIKEIARTHGISVKGDEV